MRLRPYTPVAVRAAALIALAFAPPRVASAQCPDGSAPPCRVVAVASSRRADPPIDAKTWIVLPFEFSGPAPQDVGWMRDASANLLYLDMSRWSDVRVVDDERVADLLRDTPGASAQPLPLNAGLAVARRAGAGRLVMGDLLRAGSRVAVIAKVFDVKDGRRLRSLREETMAEDSVFGVFSRLARGILDVAPPAGARLGEVGTTRVDAYQAYLTGLRQLHSFALSEAAASFGRAVQLDSAFALAHYKRAQTLLWANGTDPSGRTHAERALQLSGRLPSRERTLIKAFAYFPRGEFGAMCETYAPLLRADSSDLEVVGGMADCLFHDRAIVRDPLDSTHLVFRGDFNASLRLFRRALDLDPTYHLAYQHFIDVYLRDSRSGVEVAAGTSPPSSARPTHIAVLDNVSDSLVTAPIRGNALSPGFEAAELDYLRSRAKLRNLQRARAIAEEWLAAAPSEGKARMGATRVYRALGLNARALETLPPAAMLAGTDSINLALIRADLLMRTGDFQTINVMIDSATAVEPGGIVGAGLGTIVGRFRAWETKRFGNSPPPPSPGVSYSNLGPRVVAGLPADSAVALEAALLALPNVTAARVLLTLTFALTHPRARWPVFDSMPTIQLRPAAAVARNDTAALRRAARDLDSLGRLQHTGGAGDNGNAIHSALAYVALGDTASALREVRWALDTAITLTSAASFLSGAATGLVLFRAMVLRADLAAAAGQQAEARTWYKRSLDLWVRPDADLQPFLDRIRKAYAAVGGT